MDLSAQSPKTQKEQPLERVQALLEVLLLSGLLTGLLASLPFAFRSGHHGGIPPRADSLTAYILLEAAMTLLLLSFLLRAGHETLADIGMHWHKWRSDALIGIALVPVLFLTGATVTLTFRVFLPSQLMERNPLMDTIQTPRDLALFLLSALLAGGIKEEFQRAFILNRFSRYLGGSGLGLVVWSIAFGVGHYLQGVQGMVTATLFGILLGAAYFARGGLVTPIVAHALYDSFALAAFWFTRPAHP
jgi:membrane protease YdiL (CAAX protease family)